MDNYGLIIQHLRLLSGLSVRQTAKKIERSVGWLSEIENARGRSKLSDKEFDRIVELLNGTQHKAMFRTWVANYKNRERLDKTFDGAVLKFIRVKKEMSLQVASELTGLSVSFLSKVETGLKPIPLELRNQIMAAYGYSSSSWKNLATDPVRSKVVPLEYKLGILLNGLQESQIEKVFYYVQGLFNEPSKNHEQTTN